MYIFLAIIIHNSVNGTCQGHTEMLLGDCRTVLHTFIHQHNDVTDFLISWDFYILMTIWTNQTRINFVKWKLSFISSLMPMLNFIVH